MFIIVFRTILVYVIIVFAMRFIGKKHLGELNPSELVCTILISNLASISIETPAIPLINSLIPLVLIVSLEMSLSYTSFFNRKFATLLSGKPRLIIFNGKIDHQALKDLRYTTDDLIEALHGKDIFDFDEVSFAVIEPNGSMTVAKNDSSAPVTKGDLNIANANTNQPLVPIVIDGCFNQNFMTCCSVNTDWVALKLSDLDIAQKNVLIMLCNSDHEYKVIKKG